MTALHCASHSGQENTVRLLLNVTGVMADAATTMTETTPLHLAARNGKLPVASLLLSKIGPKIDIRDKKGRTALMLAAGNGHLEMVTLLVGQGSDITALDNNDWTPLHFAAISGHLKVVKYLVESGAATSVKNKDGKIPMGLAAGATKAQVVLFLVTKAYDAYSLMEDRTFLFDLMMCGRKEQNRPLQDFIINSASPVEIGLKISRFYTDLAGREKEQERDLNLAAKFVESLASDLLVISCNKFNPAVILRAVDSTDKSLMNILIEGEHKEVVALPAVQRYLTAVWHGNQHWSDTHSFVTFLGFLFFPPFWFFASLPLGHKYNYIPFVKLMSHIVSHMFFILLLLLAAMASFEKLYEFRNVAPTAVEVFLLIWIAGKIVHEFTTKEERNGLGLIRVVIIVLCLMGVVLHGIAFAFADSDYYKTTEVLYARNQIFALASLFAFIQIIR
ncbi:hypothetical protein RvY_09866-2 [Ramazzottius varieornatus]|uniref:Uncharacterized protein n=1 Tax=Ramazzottius varieornatus TaxID=947166 RepID=A0A1D1VAU6_RAMVA|nr:hypothetical protein RvY_09866-2 [Ramazzottius varieornatus]